MRARTLDFIANHTGWSVLIALLLSPVLLSAVIVYMLVAVIYGMGSILVLAVISFLDESR